MSGPFNPYQGLGSLNALSGFDNQTLTAAQNASADGSNECVERHAGTDSRTPTLA